MCSRNSFSDWEWRRANPNDLAYFKLFSNANERMCSSLKSVKIATSAVGVRRRTCLYFVPRFLTAKRKRDFTFFNGDMHTVVNNYFDWRLLGLKSITP